MSDNEQTLPDDETVRVELAAWCDERAVLDVAAIDAAAGDADEVAW